MDECPNCGAKVYPSDKRCRKCGENFDNKKINVSSKMIIAIVAVVIIIAIVGAFASGVFTGNDTASNDSSVETSDSVSQDTGDDDAGSTEYWASEKTEKFHKPDCEWAEKIGEDNKIIYQSREDAIADGKEPCNVCNP